MALHTVTLQLHDKSMTICHVHVRQPNKCSAGGCAIYLACTGERAMTITLAVSGWIPAAEVCNGIAMILLWLCNACDICTVCDLVHILNIFQSGTPRQTLVGSAFRPFKSCRRGAVHLDHIITTPTTPETPGRHDSPEELPAQGGVCLQMRIRQLRLADPPSWPARPG